MNNLIKLCCAAMVAAFAIAWHSITVPQRATAASLLDVFSPPGGMGQVVVWVWYGGVEWVGQGMVLWDARRV
jgi:hypothetical protein